MCCSCMQRGEGVSIAALLEFNCIELWVNQPDHSDLSPALTGVSSATPPGSQSIETYYSPKILTAFKNSTRSWVEFSAGQHHTVCLDSEGEQLGVGRNNWRCV